MADLTPKHVVEQLDRYIVGQIEAKRALALALRERERRKKLEPEVRADIGSKNILVIGPTGAGKTELARRLAKLVDAPFLKTEATKFTEVGYVGRDVESIVRELVDSSVAMVHQERFQQVQDEARRVADERIIGYLLGAADTVSESDTATTERPYMKRKRRALARRLAEHELDENMVEIEVESDESVASVVEFASGIGPEEIHDQFQEFIQQMNASRRRSRRVPVREAKRILTEQEAQRLIDLEDVVDVALKRVEESGMVFLDEIDKLATRGNDFGPDVSGEGVQRDLLPIVEGATIATRYGVVSTDHILFIGAGAFNRARPSDLLPELQGRFPIRVEVKDLNEDDFVAILTEPENALTKQYQALLSTEDLELVFTEDGIRAIARFTARLNEQTENLGARRLFGVMERVIEDISFRAPDLAGQTMTIDSAYVEDRMSGVPFTADASKYIL